MGSKRRRIRTRRPATGVACSPRTTITKPSPGSAPESWATPAFCRQSCAAFTLDSSSHADRTVGRHHFHPHRTWRNHDRLTAHIQPYRWSGGRRFDPVAISPVAVAEYDELPATTYQVHVQPQLGIVRNRIHLRELDNDGRRGDLFSGGRIQVRGAF